MADAFSVPLCEITKIEQGDTGAYVFFGRYLPPYSDYCKTTLKGYGHMKISLANAQSGMVEICERRKKTEESPKKEGVPVSACRTNPSDP
jgi:hypothetical protein